MQPISYCWHQFPPEIIRHAVRLYLRFTLSDRDVEELLPDAVSIPMRRSGNRFSNLARPLLATCVGCDRDQVTSGTWTRWWSRSRADVCPCGGLSIVRNQARQGRRSEAHAQTA